MGYYLKKSEVKKLKYNTLTKVEKKYKEIKSNMFDFEGFDTDIFEELQKSVYMIFQSNIVESQAEIEKMIAGKEHRAMAFYEFKTHESGKAYEWIDIFFGNL